MLFLPICLPLYSTHRQVTLVLTSHVEFLLSHLLLLTVARVSKNNKIYLLTE